MKAGKVCLLLLFLVISTLTLSNATALENSKPSDGGGTRVALTGIKTIGAGGDYTTFTAAITDLNTNGVGSGGIIFNVISGSIFVENPPAITATGTLANQIVFQKSDIAHAVIKPTGTTGTSDFGICINGGDYITFDGIDIVINSGFAVEFGYYLKGNTSDGDNYNTIQNCVISLSASNTQSKAVYTQTTGNVLGSRNNYNHFYNLAISNCATGVNFTGSGTANMEDLGNEFGILPGGTTTVNVSGGSGTAYGVYVSNQRDCVVSNITFSSITSNMVSYGIYTVGNSFDTNISNNHFITLTGTYTAVAINLQGKSANVFKNDVTGLTCVSSSASGIIVNSGTTISNIYDNLVHNINVGGNSSCYGINVGGGDIINTYNNFVYDIKAPSSAMVPGIFGIAIIAGTSNYVFHNTVILSASTSAANLTSTAFMGNTTASLIDVRNNIFVNNSSVGAGVAGKAVAHWRNTTALTNFASSSNNNLLYAGTPSAQHLVYYDGTNSGQMLVDYKNLVYPRELNAVYENPPITDALSNLHIQPGIGTQVESGGVVISAPFVLNLDFDDQTRAAIPDIGADEGEFAPLELTPPSIGNVVLQNTASQLNRVLPDIAITDFSGVDVTTGTAPRIYYKKSTEANVFGANDSSFSGWKWTETLQTSSPFSFEFDYTKLFTPIAQGDLIQYFVVAQDLVSTPNVGAMPFYGFAGTSVASITSAPTTPASFYILTLLNGVKTVGTGGDYPTLTAAIAIFNNSEIVGPSEFQLLDTDYSTLETFPLILNSIPGQSATNTLTIRPANGVTGITITGNSITALFYMNNVDYVIIDGSNNVTNSKDLTIYNSGAMGNTIQFAGDASYNTVRNCLIKSSSTLSTNAVVYVSTTANGNNNTILNCSIFDGSSKPYNGVFMTGSFNGMQTVRNCTIYNIASYGVNLSNASANGIVIDNNDIHDCTQIAIYHYNGISTSITSNNIYMTTASNYAAVYGIAIYSAPTMVISKNRIHDLKGAGTATIYGIFQGTPLTATSVSVYNNEVYLETGASSTTGTVYGLAFSGNASVTIDYSYNSVYIGGTGVTGTGKSYAFGKISAGGNLKLKDNVLVNMRSNSTGTGKHYGVGFISSNYTSLEINYNDYYAGGTGGVLGLLGTSDQTTIAAWKIAVPQDANSQGLDPSYTFGTNYLSPATTSLIARAGTPLGTVTDDILGTMRSVSMPTMGAYEIPELTIPNPAVVVSPIDGAIDQLLDVTLNWSASRSAATSFILNFGTDNPPTNIAHNSNLGLVYTYSPSTLTAGTTYYWQIIPTNAAGNATGCPVWSFTTIAPLVPDPPINVTATLNGTDCVLNWDAVSGATSYNVYGCLDPYVASPVWYLLDNVTTNTYTHSATTWSKYFYQVTSVVAGKK